MVNDFFDKLTRAADAFAEIMMEDVGAEALTRVFTYQDFKELVISKRRIYPRIQKCTISIRRKNEIENKVYAEAKYEIRIVMLDADKNPICIENSIDEYVGAYIVADSIDKQLRNFMGEKTEKTVVVGGK